MSLWTDSAPRRAGFASFGRGVPHLEAVDRLKDCTRQRFGLVEEDAIVVSETTCPLPGFPAVETVVGFWTAGSKRHHFRVFKPVEDIDESDLPPVWLKDSLADSDGIECYCC